jgi:Carboxypeptidase regulatory-like domain/TonB dependent receptor
MTPADAERAPTLLGRDHSVSITSFARAILQASVLLVAFHTIAVGQSLDAVVQGRVADASGAAVPGAVITASHQATGLSRSATTDNAGHYALRNLPPSRYDVKAELSGFASAIVSNQTLHVGSTVTIDFSLAVAGMAERVDVGGRVPALDITRNAVGRVVQRVEIDALPVVNRNFNDLAALSAGVTKTGPYGGVDISGSRDFQNAYQVDGVSAKRQRLGDPRMPYAQDWIDEFQVLTTQFNPEFGQASGGVVNVITRSGSNRLTGRAYGFLRNDAFDARPVFATRKPPLDEQRIGGTLGGPVVRNRLFYFGGIERFSNRSSSVVSSAFARSNGTFPFEDTQVLSLAKADIAATAHHSVRVRFNGQREQTTGADVGGIRTAEHGRFLDTRSNDVGGGWSWVASPATLNEMRVGWSTSYPATGCTFALENPVGTWFERSYPGAQLGCPVNFGTIGEDQLQLVENLSWTHGRHDVKVGAQAFWTRTFGDFRNLRDGRYAFERDVLFDPADPGSYPFAFTRIEGETTWDAAGWSGGVFAQDSWRLARDLTVNLGIRYDVDGSISALNPLVRIDQGLHTIDKDLDNVAPRAGVTWTPFHDDKRTIVRGGAGIYYDQNHNNVTTALLLNNILVTRITAVNANNPSLNPFWPDIAAAKRWLADALAQNTVPDLSATRGLVGATNDVDQDLQIPRTTQVSGGIVREFARWINASADVVYSRGRDLYVIRDTNLDPITFRRINPNYSSITSFGNEGWNEYKALQAQINIVPSARHLVKAAYTLATNRSNTSATLSTGVATNPFDLAEDEGPTDNDVRQIVVISGSTTLPLGLQVSGLFSSRTALPYSAVTFATREDGKPFGFRPEPRNARRGDGALSLDMRVAKVVPVSTTGRMVTAFVEAFNLTNQSNYGDYIGNVRSSLFGRPTTASPKRRLQLGLRLDF